MSVGATTRAFTSYGVGYRGWAGYRSWVWTWALCLGSIFCGCGVRGTEPAGESISSVASPLESSSQPGANKPKPEPVHDSQLHSLNQFFGEQWSQWIVELNTEPSTAVRPPAPAWLPRDVRDALESVFTTAEIAVEGAAVTSASGNDPKVDELEVVVAKLNAVLTRHKLGYVVDSVVLGSGSASSVLLFTFVIQRRVQYRGLAESEIEIVWVKRQDQLAYRYQLLGFTGVGRKPLVLLDTVENWLIADLLPTIGDSKEQAAAISRSFLRSFSRSLVAAVGEPGIRLTQLVAQRRSLFVEFNARLEESGAALRMPQTLQLGWDWRAGLASIATTAELGQLAQIEDELASSVMKSAFEHLRNLMARATEGHELQHQIELRDSRKVSATLTAAMTAMTGQLGGLLNPRQRQWMRGEVSALLAEIARAENCVMLLVARQYRLANQPGRSLERIAARLVLNLLAGEPRTANGKQERSLDRLVTMIEPLSEEQIQVVAKRAWARLFGSEFVEFARTVVTP